MPEIDYFMLAVLGFCTGLGTTFGAELAKTLFSKLSKLKLNRLVSKNAKITSDKS